LCGRTLAVDHEASAGRTSSRLLSAYARSDRQAIL
jgi:hypothetical protein